MFIKQYRLRVLTINIVVLIYLPLFITSCKSDLYKIESKEYELELLNKKIPENTKRIYYGIKDGRASYSAIYAYFHKDSLCQIWIASNNELIKQYGQFRLLDKTDVDEQLALFHQILSFISSKYMFDKVERVMVSTRGMKAMSYELLQKYDSCGNYVQSIKNSYYFSKLFEMFKSYGINIKGIEVNDVYWETFEDKCNTLSTKSNKWDNIDLNALIFLYTDRHIEKLQDHWGTLILRSDRIYQ